MDENAMIFVRPQVLGWQQCDMVSVQLAAENGSDKELQEAVSEAIDNLTWGGLRLHSFGSLPYHYELELAARVRQATSVVMPAAKEGQPDIWGGGRRSICVALRKSCCMSSRSQLRKGTQTTSVTLCCGDDEGSWCLSANISKSSLSCDDAIGVIARKL